jgi:predicted RNase H-like HicB family nuclease
MHKVTVFYHLEPEGCWAESPDVPGFSAAGSSLADVQDMVAEGLPYHLGHPVDVVEKFPETASVVSHLSASSSVAVFVSAGVVLSGQAMTRAAGTLTTLFSAAPIPSISVGATVAEAASASRVANA